MNKLQWDRKNWLYTLCECLCVCARRWWQKCELKIAQRCVCVCVCCEDQVASWGLGFSAPRSAANDSHGDLMDSFSPLDTFRHTPSINIMLTLRGCVSARVCVCVCVSRADAYRCPNAFKYVRGHCAHVRLRVTEHPWMIDSGVIYCSAVTSIPTSPAFVHPWGAALSLFICYSLPQRTVIKG